MKVLFIAATEGNMITVTLIDVYKRQDNVYAIYEYSTIDAFRKANEESPMDIVFVEDTTDNCGLAVARYIREKEQRTSFY